MKYIIYFLLSFTLLFGIEYTPKEKQFLKNNPVIYISAMTYWPVDKNGNSIHTNYMKLLNKYGNLNLQPVYYRYWSDGFDDAKSGITSGIMALSYSKKRTKWFYFTKAYNFNPYYLVVNKDSEINSIKDLKGKTIHIARHSILREILKKSNFNIVYKKDPFKELSEKKIDGILLFYVPNTKYINQFKLIKTFINKAGEEHIGISKKYPELFSIIKKAMAAIPYNEIEKIRAIPYEKRISYIKILRPKVTLKDLISPQDIIFIFILILGLGVIIYLFVTKKFLDWKIKKFLITVFIFDVVVLGFIIYEILAFHYYSTNILNLQTRSFKSLYLVDKIEKAIRNENYIFARKYKKRKGNIYKLFMNEYPIFGNLLVDNQPVKNIINTKYFTQLEIAHLGYIGNQFSELLYMQQQVLAKKMNFSIYIQNYLYLLNEINVLKDVIKKENTEVIYVIKEKLRYQFMLLLFGALLFILESILVFILIRKKIYNPISYLTKVIKNYQSGKITPKKTFYKDEMNTMIEEFFSLHKQLSKKIDELHKHKENLQKEVQEEVDKRLYQEKILLKKSRFALMGEMIDAIAHQWRQPLNNISLSAQLLNLEKDNKNFDKKAIETAVENISMQVQYMDDTLEEFRYFLRDIKNPEKFCMANIVKNVLLLLKDDLLKHKITISTKIDIDFCINGNKNEFKHLLITIITNAKDMFNERHIEKRKITIQTREENDFYYLEIIDNAGGVSEYVIDKIFELNFTTRENGTGVGLYLAKQIAVRHNGDLIVENVENGAKFYFKVKKDV